MLRSLFSRRQRGEGGKAKSAEDTMAADQGIQEGATFPLFSDLTEELKVMVLSYVTDAPHEKKFGNFGSSSLTNALPLVSKAFHKYCSTEDWWEKALVRQVRSDKFLWRTGVERLAGGAGEAAATARRAAAASDDGGETSDEEPAEALAERARQNLTRSTAAPAPVSYQVLYEHVLNNYLRFTSPVFFMSGTLQVGEPYALHFFEPRYRLLIREAMANQSEEARHGGPIRGEVLFVHANRGQAPRSPAVLVQVQSCTIYNDGRADVFLLPVANILLQKLWVRPNSHHLYYARCMRMGKSESEAMNNVARQETLGALLRRR